MREAIWYQYCKDKTLVWAYSDHKIQDPVDLYSFDGSNGSFLI